MKKIISILSIAFVLIGITGCSSDNDPVYRETYMNIATLTKNSSTSGTEFQYRVLNDSPVITLTSPTALPESQVEIGQRLLLTYQLADGTEFNQSGPINLLQVGLIPNITFTQEDWCNFLTDYPDWLGANQMQLQVLVRSGQYINFQARMPIDSNTTASLKLVGDALTASNTIPDLYLIHDYKMSVSSYETTMYASFDISEIWDNPRYEGFTIHVNNTGDTQKAFVFKKNAN